MNQLSHFPIDRHAIDLVVSRPAASNVVSFAAARANLRAAARPLVCHWRRDPVTGALRCAWTASRGARESTADVPLRRAI